jgi:hypothetical protein
MLIIAYSDKPAYFNMIRRMNLLCEKFDIEYKNYAREWLIRQDAYKMNQKLFSHNKGGGYWAWKPLIIYDALQQTDEVLYLDSSVIIPSKEAVIRNMELTNLLSAPQTAFTNADWTKQSCFEAMGCNTEEHWYTPQIWAGMVCAKQGCYNLLMEWKYWCLEYNIITDVNNFSTFPTFKDHRHDQSILTNVLLKYKQSYLDPIGFLDENNFNLKY